LRAPTPSAAGELVVPVKSEIDFRISELRNALIRATTQNIVKKQLVLNELLKRLIHPERKIQELQIRLDELSTRLFKGLQRFVSANRERAEWHRERIYALNPETRTILLKDRLSNISDNLLKSINNYMFRNTSRLREVKSMIHNLNPDAILRRGYSITRTLPGKMVIRDTQNVSEGQHLELILHRGSLNVNIDEIKPEKG